MSVKNFIRYVTLHDGVWPYVSDPDSSKDFKIPDGDFCILRHNGIRAGYVAFIQNGDFKTAHIAVLPEHRGKWVVDAVRECLSKIDGKIKARVRHNRVYALAYKVGFRKTGIDAGDWIDMELKRWDS